MIGRHQKRYYYRRQASPCLKKQHQFIFVFGGVHAATRNVWPNIMSNLLLIVSIEENVAKNGDSMF